MGEVLDVVKPKLVENLITVLGSTSREEIQVVTIGLKDCSHTKRIRNELLPSISARMSIAKFFFTLIGEGGEKLLRKEDDVPNIPMVAIYRKGKRLIFQSIENDDLEKIIEGVI
jgi:hypothetical protein